MVTQETIKDFLDKKNLAIAGVSRSGKKFGNMLFNELKDRGYNVTPLHPEADEIEGVKAFKTISELPENPEWLVTVVKPHETIKLIKEANEAGIDKVWMQLGSDSKEAVVYCKDNDIECIQGHCLMMFMEPVGFLHRMHRGLLKLFGKYPKSAPKH